MYNHFRTLLLNLSDKGDTSEHITAGFTAKQLPAVLAGFHQLLFPLKSSREFRLFLAHNYLKLIESAGLADAITALDNRITYDTDSNEHFQSYRKSNPVYSDPNFPLFIHGDYVVTNDIYSDKLLIQQNESTPTEVSIFSYGHKCFIVGSELSDDRIFATVNYTSPHISDDIGLEHLGLRLQIAKISGSFTDTVSKVWEVLVDAPKVFNFHTIYNRVGSSSIPTSLIALPSKLPTSNFDNLWLFHPNPVYRLAGLIVAYVYRVNNDE